jgi:hypothetical protein
VRAAMVEWGTVPKTPIAMTMSGSKVHDCTSLVPGTRRAIEAHGFRRSHGSYLACLRLIAALRLASSATVNSMGRLCAGRGQGSTGLDGVGCWHHRRRRLSGKWRWHHHPDYYPCCHRAGRASPVIVLGSR